MSIAMNVRGLEQAIMQDKQLSMTQKQKLLAELAALNAAVDEMSEEQVFDEIVYLMSLRWTQAVYAQMQLNIN